MAHRPLAGIVISFAIGISISYLADVPFFLVVTSVFTTIVVYIVLFTFHLRGTVLTLLILTLLAGISYHYLRFFSTTDNNISNVISTERIPVRLRGIVISPPINKFMPDPPLSTFARHKKMVTFLLKAKAIESALPLQWKNITGVIKVNVYPTKQEETTLTDKSHYLLDRLHYGDKIEFAANIAKPSTTRNPGQFDYRNYLKRQRPRVEAVASVVYVENITVLSGGHGNYFLPFIYGLKKELNAIIERTVQKRSIPVVNSILLGDREQIPEDLINGFLETGTIHFLAISGLHVGILVVSLHYLLRLSGMNIRFLAIIIILAVFIYASITGMKTPVIRAGIMTATCYGAFIINRRWDLPGSIAGAVLIILLINPSDLFNVGFQLSVLAVLGIMFIPNRLENYFWKSTLLVEKLQAKEERNEMWFRLKIYCRKTFCVSLAAWVAVMPLIAYYFHVITPLAVLLNILMFPLVWLILVGGFVILLAGCVFPVLVPPFAWLVSYSEIAMENLILPSSAHFKTFFYTSTPSWIWILSYYLLVIFFMLGKRLNIKIAHMIIAAMVVSNAYVFSGIFGHSRDCLKLTCLDVGHGASSFIQFPNGKNMLFDTGTKGNYDVGRFIVAPFLWQKGIRKVDTIVLSHGHDDHCNGAPSIVRKFKVDNVFINKFFLQSGEKTELLKFFAEKKIKTGLLANGLEIKGYEPAKITVLNPPDKDTLRILGFHVGNLSVNDSSSVLLIDYMDCRIMLCADLGEWGIKMLLAGRDNLKANVIQVPHHGGFIANTEDLIKSVMPEHAIISGFENDISSSTIEAYQKYGVCLHKTHECGTVTFTINKDGIQVSKFL